MRRAASPHLRLAEPPRAAPGATAATSAVSAELFAELRAGSPGAQRALVRAFWPRVTRTLRSVLGAVHDLDDLAQEVFIRVFDRLDRVRSPHSLPAFIVSTAVFVARESIRGRARRRWLIFSAPEELPELALGDVGPEVAAAIEAFYAVLASLGVDERVAFSLRHVDDMDLAEVARATGASLATVKRRLARAEAEFAAKARGRSELARLLEEGGKWPIVPR